MSPRRTCIVCEQQAPKYTCAPCRANYCSVACYSQHKETCAALSYSQNASDVRVNALDGEGAHSSVRADTDDHAVSPSKDKDEEPLPDPSPLRPLTTLKWPYVPDASAYPDPLTRDDPKPLQMHQYEALATSSTIRDMLGSNARLRALLTSVNALRGVEREEALQRALGIDGRQLKNEDAGTPIDDDTKAFRAFAEAVEALVRGGRKDLLGLDWD